MEGPWTFLLQLPCPSSTAQDLKLGIFQVDLSLSRDRGRGQTQDQAQMFTLSGLNHHRIRHRAQRQAAPLGNLVQEHLLNLSALQKEGSAANVGARTTRRCTREIDEIIFNAEMMAQAQVSLNLRILSILLAQNHLSRMMKNELSFWKICLISVTAIYKRQNCNPLNDYTYLVLGDLSVVQTTSCSMVNNLLFAIRPLSMLLATVKHAA
jgi:hypothetical protein